ncbi:MAG TPA: hypothetical protein VHV08_15510 [Pirellulales bacterium]|jgi:proline dehydrogenase|nr:hypothetical protein [Pirellulales bacterium]
MRLLAGCRTLVASCARPLAERAAKSYVAGDTLDDALDVADQLEARGLGISLGYWDGPDDTPRGVADEYLAGIEALAGQPHGYISMKVPSLDYSRELVAEIAQCAMQRKVRLHFDALAPDSADRSRALGDELLDRGATLSYTLPGRWARSVADAAWAADRGITVRVVKGQWPDPSDPGCDLRAGFLRTIDALAGRARHVAVASHDPSLVAEAIGRLQAAGTSCELELLHGLPMRASLKLADRLALGVHVYVPYGKAYLPYALSRARANPRILWWLVRDLVTSWRRGMPVEREPSTLTAH